MKHSGRLAITTLIAILMTAFPVMAGNAMNHAMQHTMDAGRQMQGAGMNMRRNMHDSANMREGMNMGKNAHGNMGMMGKQIRQTTIDGYKLSYKVIDMHAQMPGNPEMAGTWHLMVSFKDSAGRPVTSATVGYLVRGPDGKVQKAMAMTMGKSFGANIKLTEKGEYAITAKALIGGKKIIDRFAYSPEQ